MKWISRREYLAIHAWLKYNYGKATKCVKCNDEDKKYHYALKKGKTHKRNIEHYIQLCTTCHIKYDRPNINMLHKYRTKESMRKIQEAKYKEIIQCSITGKYIKKWKSATHVNKKLGISRSAINNNIKGLSKSAGGFIWQRNG